MSTFACFAGKAFLGKPTISRLVENTDVNSWIIFRMSYNNYFASALGGACANGTNTMALIQTCEIQAIMTLPQRLSFSAQLSDCNVATCWQFELSKLSRLQLSTFIRAMGSVVLLSSFIPNQPLAGPCANLGVLLAQPQESTDVQCLPLPIFLGRLARANLQKSFSSYSWDSIGAFFYQQLRITLTIIFWCGCAHIPN